jgi:DNA replication protein DnaC
MQSMGELLKDLMPELTMGSEVNRYICSGCRNEVVIVQTPLLGGPDKGKMVTQKRGCICWEIEQARETKHQQRAMKVNQMVNRYSTVNPDLEAATFDSFKVNSPNLKAALELAQDYAERFNLDSPINLLFAGMYGLGKSHLSYAICKSLRAKGHIAVFVSVPKILTVIKSTYQRDSHFSEAELMNVLSNVDLLAMDDIGAERARREDDGETWATEKLFEIIDGRSGRHTIYTTNLTSDDLAKRIGQRNFSRMMMNTKPFKFEGMDYRISNKRF